MSYVLPILKSLPETHSTSLAILASLGVHGLAWVVLPVIPFNSKSVEPVSQRTIGLVQLTPSELNRLPQASTPPVQLPTFATQPSTLPPLPPPPDFSLLLPQIPNATANYEGLLNVPIQPQFQTLAPLSVPHQNKTVPSKPEIQNNLVPFKFDNRLPPPPPSSWTPPPTNRLPYVPVKPAPMPDFLTNLPSPTPTTSSTPAETAINTPPANAPVVTPGTGRIPQRTIDELLARRAQLREPSPQRDSSGSTLVALTEDLRKWFTEVNPTSSQTRRLSPTYPQQACLRKLEGTASIVVLVNPQGNIINGPRLNKTTGYDLLDQAAVAAVKEYRFKPRSDERQAYLFGVEYKPDNASCADTSKPEPANRNSPTPQPTPESRNSPVLPPTPEGSNPATPQPTPESRGSLRSILEGRSTSPQPTPEESNSATPEPTPENPSPVTPATPGNGSEQPQS